MFNRIRLLKPDAEPAAKFFNKITIAHDKGKLAARRGRKAVESLERSNIEVARLQR